MQIIGNKCLDEKLGLVWFGWRNWVQIRAEKPRALDTVRYTPTLVRLIPFNQYKNM